MSNAKTDRNITVTIKIDLGNADAADVTTAYYVGKHVKQIGYHIMERQGELIMTESGSLRRKPSKARDVKIRDDNGNTIGEWSLDGDLTD